MIQRIVVIMLCMGNMLAACEIQQSTLAQMGVQNTMWWLEILNKSTLKLLLKPQATEQTIEQTVKEANSALVDYLKIPAKNTLARAQCQLVLDKHAQQLFAQSLKVQLRAKAA